MAFTLTIPDQLLEDLRARAEAAELGVDLRAIVAGRPDAR